MVRIENILREAETGIATEINIAFDFIHVGETFTTHRTLKLSSPGEIFIPFESLSENQVIEWVLNSYSAAQLNYIAANIMTPTALLSDIANGIPWQL